jgi:hypothetical protein
MKLLKNITLDFKKLSQQLNNIVNELSKTQIFRCGKYEVMICPTKWNLILIGPPKGKWSFFYKYMIWIGPIAFACKK